jgi:hypothetical protein
MKESVWSPSEAREAIRTDLARVRRGYSSLVARREETLLVDALRGDEPALASLEAFKVFVCKLIEVRGYLAPDGAERGGGA